MEDLKVKILSSLEKCFPDDSLENKPEKKRFSTLRGQTVSFLVAICSESDYFPIPLMLKPVLQGDMAEYAELFKVQYVPVQLPADPMRCDDGYLSKKPGLYPDALRPLFKNGVDIYPHSVQCLFCRICLPMTFPAGVHELTLELWESDKNELAAREIITLELLDLTLPEQETVHTEWFYTDCLAEQYNVRVFSNRHFKIIENYIRSAVKNGINMILTPIFTPALDTYKGGERLTTQLVGIEYDGKEYSFDFSKLRRWVDICLRCGVKYFEMPHFFTQWGAAHAPKIVARADGRIKRIFGWQTDSSGEEYRYFLSCFIPALTEELERLGVKDRTFFHISDEPSLLCKDAYQKCSELLKPYLDGIRTVDALSEYEFYKLGTVDIPIPATKHIDAFLGKGISPLWTYYCGILSGDGGLSGRYLAFPSYRTRIIGVQLYMGNITGFLHWGYNFWKSCLSYDTVDPRIDAECGGFNPAGDCFLVYPGDGDMPWESLRLNSMREAMDDIRLLSLHESIHGREATERAVLEVSGGKLDFKNYPKDNEFFFALQKRLIEGIGKGNDGKAK